MKKQRAEKLPETIIVGMTGQQLIAALKAAEITQAEIAREAELFESDVSRIRRGLREASEVTWRALAALAMQRCTTAQLEAARHF